VRAKIVFTAITIVISSFGFAKAQLFSLRTQSLGQGEKKLAKNLMDEATSLLPLRFKSALASKKIVIEFKSFSRNRNKVERTWNDDKANECKLKKSTSVVYGRYKSFSHKIELSAEVLGEYSRGIINLKKCNRRAGKELALSVILHELIHAYDDVAKIKRERVKNCFEEVGRGSNRVKKRTGFCKRLERQNSRSHIISDDWDFLRRISWHGVNKKDNKSVRSPDLYETSNPKEFLAVNFEFFMLDSKYQCRRPELYRYLSEHFKHIPFAEENCKINTKLPLDDGLVDLDPKKIFQVEYLLASKGKGIGSGFGHSMIRLVMCAPKRYNYILDKVLPATPLGSKCREESLYDVVISFRATVTDFQINNYSGLVGKYPSRPYLHSLTRIQEEYNNTDFRDLYSYPIKLSEKEKEQMIHKFIEMFWAYRGSYKFITNNCATETYKLITAGLKNQRVGGYAPLMPYSVLRDLKKLGLVSKGNDFSTFKSKESRYMKALSFIGEGDIEEINRKDLFEYLFRPFEQREAVLETLSDSRSYASFILLERRAQAVTQKRLFSLLSKNYRNVLNKYQGQFFVDNEKSNDLSYGIPLYVERSEDEGQEKKADRDYEKLVKQIFENETVGRDEKIVSFYEEIQRSKEKVSEALKLYRESKKRKEK
jgi:hypothetical protein